MAWPLAALGHSVLERNMDAGKLREFKLAFMARLAGTGSVVERALRLSPGHGARLLMRSFALTRGRWQAADRSEPAARAETDAVLASLHPDFDAELTEALTEYWRGALVPPSPGLAKRAQETVPHASTTD